MKLRTGIRPPGQFVFGIHRPRFQVRNLRENETIASLGENPDGTPVDNTGNFPDGDVVEEKADPIFEVPNAFPFRGTTFIAKTWADAKAGNPSAIRLPQQPAVSFQGTLEKWFDDPDLSVEKREALLRTLPEPLQIALAATSTDPLELSLLVRISCDLVYDQSLQGPVGIRYTADSGGNSKPSIGNVALFETLANNPNLPDSYKKAMVLRPGVQGSSEIVGEWSAPAAGSHIFEYLRRNSYIPWGHYAANMADDAVRYRISDLSESDMAGLRHLYYQRSFTRIAELLGIALPPERKTLTTDQLEVLRTGILEVISGDAQEDRLPFTATLWGWNFGFDYSQSHYRLHASHQQVHQQFALVPRQVAVEEPPPSEMPAYSCGDLITEFVLAYRQETGRSFFADYLRAIRSNRRMDGNASLPCSLVVYENEHVVVFVPKAQTSQWEIQLVTLASIGNIFEAETAVRRAIDLGILKALQALTAMGAKMVSSIEYSKRIGSACSEQHLLYAFLPKLPESPGAFSEAQLRWINGHYPEDFAAACREALLS